MFGLFLAIEAYGQRVDQELSQVHTNRIASGNMYGAGSQAEPTPYMP